MTLVALKTVTAVPKYGVRVSETVLAWKSIVACASIGTPLARVRSPVRSFVVTTCPLQLRLTTSVAVLKPKASEPE